MARLSIDASQVLAEAARVGKLAPEIQQMASKVLRAGSFLTEKEVKQAAAVDTGRLRASWGHWTSADVVKANPDASEGDSIWQESPTSIEQGSNLPYAEVVLNEGHSSQMPAGSLDAAALRGEQRLEQAMDRALEHLTS